MVRLDCLAKVIFIFSTYLLGITGTITAQTWDWVETYGNTGQQSAQGLIALPDGGLLLFGTYSGALELGGNTLEEIGEDDIFLVKIQPEQGIAWSLSGGSLLDDQIVAVASTPEGNLLATGTYWQKIHFDSLTLNASLNAKAIYFTQIGPDGQVQWIKGINGSNLKQVEDLVVDEAGNSYLCGYFSGILQVEDEQLTAVGETDLFLISYNDEGGLRWAKRAGYTGDTRALTLTLSPESDLILGGIFNDTTLIAGTLMPAETYDDDVFIASYNSAGEAQWVRKAGGVLEESITHVTTDADGNILVTGYLVGVMDLHNGQAIQSNTVNSDFYILKYTPTGEVVWAFAYGGDEVQQTRGLVLAEGQIVLSGYFQGAMSFGPVSLDAGANIHGFVAGFNTEGQPRWGVQIAGGGLVLPVEVVRATDGRLYLAGSFSGSIDFDNNNYPSAGNYDLFVARLSNAVNPVVEPQSPTVTVFPNPATGQLFIKTDIAQYDLALLNPEGKLVYKGRNEKQISLQNLAAGTYTLLFNTQELHLAFPVVFLSK